VFEHVRRLATVVVAVVDVNRADRLCGADGGAQAPGLILVRRASHSMPTTSSAHGGVYGVALIKIELKSEE